MQSIAVTIKTIIVLKNDDKFMLIVKSANAINYWEEESGEYEVTSYSYSKGQLTSQDKNFE